MTYNLPAIRGARVRRIERALYAQDADTRDMLTNEAIRAARAEQDARIDSTSPDIRANEWERAYRVIRRAYDRRFWASLFLQLREMEAAR